MDPTNDDLSEDLHEAVKKFSCLWDLRVQGYRDRSAKENAWRDIQKELRVEYEEVDLDDLKKKWKRLRDYFV